ncbi:uncharacterized protein EI90DRAFT_3065683 [Cantharellus anzutake]|uniref:uncharacterized protein n=1 Tax=Cantharellus anzutake TaxID=1750568 RepID=UPI001905680D|nr:uncharacterized protein EI90DRAFT_3065683 [Cantharellus anzutake]KAF8328127.1 hypothetical protein EI90DRAFT_3065683 [Cantharellus anzutake]
MPRVTVPAKARPTNSRVVCACKDHTSPLQSRFTCRLLPASTLATIWIWLQSYAIRFRWQASICAETSPTAICIRFTLHRPPVHIVPQMTLITYIYTYTHRDVVVGKAICLSAATDLGWMGQPSIPESHNYVLVSSIIYCNNQAQPRRRCN